VHFRHEGSSAVVENRIGALWIMRRGKPVRCEMFPEREKAPPGPQEPRLSETSFSPAVCRYYMPSANFASSDIFSGLARDAPYRPVPSLAF
jgi:hypothetical protein